MCKRQVLPRVESKMYAREDRRMARHKDSLFGRRMPMFSCEGEKRGGEREMEGG